MAAKQLMLYLQEQSAQQVGGNAVDDASENRNDESIRRLNGGADVVLICSASSKCRFADRIFQANASKTAS